LRHRRIVMCLRALAVSIIVAAGSMPPASAQQQAPPSSILMPPASAPMSLAEFQAFTCAGTGLVTGISALGYVDPITIVTAGPGAPLLLLPVFFAGFTVGCGVGATMGPAFLWVFRHL
jgi:hypothetical protein